MAETERIGDFRCSACGRDKLTQKWTSFLWCPDCQARAKGAGPQAPRTSLLEAAEAVVRKRREGYGSPERNFDRIACVWSALLNVTITAEQVALMMIGLKLVREAYSHQEDNLVDLIGYTICLDEIVNP